MRERRIRIKLAKSASIYAGVLILLGGVFLSPSAEACSTYIGAATLNEFYRDGSTGFLEIKILDTSIEEDVYNKWYVVACSGSGQQACEGDGTSTNIGSASTINYPWFVWDEPIFEVNKTFSLNQGMDAALFDASGAMIDYVSVGGYTAQERNCPLLYDTTGVASNQSGDLYRLPDGTGSWEFIAKGPPTHAALNAGPAGDLASLAISPNAAIASTCAPQPLTITAYDSKGDVYTDYVGTISVTTSSAHGNWSINTGAGGTTPDVDDDDNGEVTYYFEPTGADAGTVTLNLTNSHADELTITVTDLADSTITATSNLYSFLDNAFVIEEAEPGLAVGADVAVAGRPHAFTASLVQRDRDDPSIDCAVAAGYDGPMVLRAWYGADASHPGTALAPGIDGAQLPPAEPGIENITLSFTDGVALFSLDTADVGKYSLELSDRLSGFAEDATGSPLPIFGGSPIVTVRPFGFGFTDIAQVAAPQRTNPGAEANDGAAGTGFVAAGESFEATLGAYLWEQGDDLDGDGLPDSDANVTDNGLTPAFAWDTALAAAGPFTPAGGVLGALAGSTAAAAGDFVGGTAALGDLSYSEVGSLTLAASATDFLNTTGVDPTGTSTIIGRFYPHRFEVSGADYVAACSGFTYMAQPADRLAYELEAVAVGGSVTVNYDAALGYAVGAVEHVAEDDNDGNDLSARMANPDPATEWVQGVFGLDADDMVFSRAGGGPDGPYVNLAVGVTVNNSDGTRLAGVDMDPATATECTADDSCTALTLATTGARFGRASVENAFGSEYLDLAVPLRAAFYAGSALGFLPNPDDGCSTPLSVVLADADPGDALDYGAGDTCVQDTGSPGASDAGCTDVAPVAQQFTDPPLAGDFNLWLRAPGADKAGAVLVDATVPAWLEYDWDGDGIHDNPPPTARAVFGSYRGDDRIIYWRERFE